MALSDTKSIVPRADQQGTLGTAAKSWGQLFLENPTDGGATALTLANLDVDQIALDINASNTTSNVINVRATSLNGGAGLFLNTADGQKDILMVSSVDTGDYCSVGTSTNGATTITTVDDDGAAAHFRVAADGNIILDAEGQVRLEPVAGNNVKIDTSVYVDGPTVELQDTSDTGDKFTIATTTHGATTLTTVDDDAAAAHLALVADGNVDVDGVNITLDSSALINIDSTGLTKFTSGSGVEIENTASAAALLIDNDTVNQVALDIDAANTTGNVIDVSASALNGGAGLYLNTRDSNAKDIKIVSSDDTADFCTLATTANGATTLTTVDAAADNAHLSFIVDGDFSLSSTSIDIDANGMISNAGWEGGIITSGFLDADTMHLSVAQTITGEKTIDGSDKLYFRDTNSYINSPSDNDLEIVATDVVIDAANDVELEAANNIVLDSAGLINVESGGLTKFTSGGGVEIENTAATPALLVDNNTVGQIALDIDAANTSANVVDIAASALNGGAGLYLNTRDSNAKDIQIVSSADTGDYFSIGTVANGATTLTTVDDDGANAHLTLTADGNIVNNCIAWDINADGAVTITSAANVDIDGAVVTLDADSSIELEGATNVTGALETTAALTADNIVCTNAATFGGGTGSTGTTITTAGVITTDGAISSTAGPITGLNYRTLWFDASEMVPQTTNGAAAGTSETAGTYDIMNKYLAFDASTIEYAQIKTIMPEQWDGGVIKAKFYWKPAASTTTSHSVVWAIDGQSLSNGYELDAWGTTISLTADDVLSAGPNALHVSGASSDVTISNATAGADELVYFRFQRVANHAQDDLNEDAHLLGVAIQYREQAAAKAAWS